MPALAFYIDAPLQSWGASSKYQHRETNNFPTKSGIIGLIAAALGIDKHRFDEAEHLRPLVALRFTAVKLGATKHHIGRLTDFHTVGGGYDKTIKWEKMSIPQKAKTGGPSWTVLTHRSYLTDARFVILLDSPDLALLEKIQSALLDPTWGVWFGRKHCIPASPLAPALAETREAAFEKLIEALPGVEAPELAKCEYQEEVASPDDEGDGIFYQSDQPVAYGRHHGAVPAPYRARGIRQHRPKTAN
ncbi:MAG: type I-E CRISPR-associated protein Cas5/CasD [Opitutales bacterium]